MKKCKRIKKNVFKNATFSKLYKTRGGKKAICLKYIDKGCLLLIKHDFDFVPFELAVKLKEKGFRKPCIAHYCCLDGNVLKFNITIDCIRESNVKCLNDENNIYTDAPTISQVLKWLRKEKKIFVSILPFATYSTIDKVAFYYLIEYNSTGEAMTSIEQNIYCAEWKDAALAGIEYVFDNLI